MVTSQKKIGKTPESDGRNLGVDKYTRLEKDQAGIFLPNRLAYAADLAHWAE